MPVVTYTAADPEIWLPIINYEAFYAISSSGKIKSLDRHCKKWDGVRKVAERILIPRKSTNGYLTIGLSAFGNTKTFQIHKIVFTHFYEKDVPKNMQINHIDGNKQNNAAYNLELLTPSANRKHAFRIGLQERPRGEKNAMAKLSNEDIVNIKAMMAAGKKDKEIAARFNASSKYINEIRNKKRRVLE